MSLVVIASVFIGFARSYFLRSHFFSAPLATIAKWHGAIFVSWIVLLFVQTVLVARHLTAVHRRLGVAGGVLAAAMVVAGTSIAVVALRYNFAHGNTRALSFFAVPIGDMVIFPVLVGAALALRRNPEAHKRLMLLATVGVLDAAVARWPLAMMAGGPAVFFPVTDLFILAGVLYDAAMRKRVHAAYIWGGLFIVALQIVRLAIWHTAPWIAFARMIAS